MIKIIFDNGKPGCLPKWARNEIATYRFDIGNAMSRLMDNDIDGALIALGYGDAVAMRNNLNAIRKEQKEEAS